VDSKPDRELESGATTDAGDTRRDAARKLGKFAAYAAPFTVLALSSKAATGSGGAPTFKR
jgi:hypothetical protein